MEKLIIKKKEITTLLEAAKDLLKYYRAKNKRLGYGDDEKNWEQEQYERERRLIKQREKMNYNKKNNNK